LLQLLVTKGFWLSTFGSMGRILTGFALGIVIGSALAVLTCRRRWMNDFFSPVIQIVKATPVASFIILALVWLPVSRMPIFIVFLMVLPVVWGNVTAGIKGTDARLLEMGRVFGLSNWQKVKKHLYPVGDAVFTAAFSTGLGLAWKAGVWRRKCWVRPLFPLAARFITQDISGNARPFCLDGYGDNTIGAVGKAAFVHNAPGRAPLQR
jgi:NitT/TauT family transport system permease protein